jgi:hypothetical protein
VCARLRRMTRKNHQIREGPGRSEARGQIGRHRSQCIGPDRQIELRRAPAPLHEDRCQDLTENDAASTLAVRKNPPTIKLSIHNARGDKQPPLSRHRRIAPVPEQRASWSIQCETREAMTLRWRSIGKHLPSLAVAAPRRSGVPLGRVEQVEQDKQRRQLWSALGR